MSANENKRNRERTPIIHWSEVELPNRPLQPRREMLTEKGFFQKKQVGSEVVLIRYDRSYISFWVKRFLLNRLNVSRNDLFRIVSDTLEIESISKTMNQPFETNIPGLGKATFAEFFQFLSEEASKGRFWVLTDNLTDRCLFLTDNAEPGRLVAPVSQHIGLNRYHAWRDNFDKYEQLKNLLEVDKAAPSFVYNYYRFDESLGHFQKTYYLIEGLFGTQCRASVSEGWELLRPSSE